MPTLTPAEIETEIVAYFQTAEANPFISGLVADYLPKLEAFLTSRTTNPITKFVEMKAFDYVIAYLNAHAASVPVVAPISPFVPSVTPIESK